MGPMQIFPLEIKNTFQILTSMQLIIMVTFVDFYGLQLNNLKTNFVRNLTDKIYSRYEPIQEFFDAD